jgi:biopolymer transport protein TolQ
MQAETDLLTLLENTSTVARVVLVILALFSLLSWGIIVAKFYVLSRAGWQSRKFWRVFRSGKGLGEVREATARLRATPLAPVLASAVEVMRPRTPAPVAATDLPGTKAPSLGIIERSMRRTATYEVTKLERWLTFLATTATVAPFVGLFGTEWGVMTAFMGLANAETATIQAVAPGIAEALVATAFGLFAAVPAVIAYNQFLYRVRNIAGEVDELQSDILVIAETEGF